MENSVVDIDQRVSMPVLEVAARVELHEGKPRLVPESWSRWHTALGREVGRRVSVVVTRGRLRRSNKANAYLWLLYHELLVELRIQAAKLDPPETCPFIDEEDVHDAMKRLFIGNRRATNVFGVSMELEPRSSLLSMEEFSSYIENIKRMASTRWNIWLSDAE